MRIIKAPNLIEGPVHLFLAGGISNCPDWQSDVSYALENSGLPDVAVNPRRTGDLAKTGSEAAYQIAWEHDALSRSEAALFWFPKETLCPITLLELGAAMMRPEQTLYVGVHPEYQRRFDVIQQLRLQRPEVLVRDSIKELLDDVIGEPVVPEFPSR